MNNEQRKTLKKIGLIVIFCVIIVLLILFKCIYYEKKLHELENTEKNLSIELLTDYYVKTPQCEIPAIEPFSAEVMKIFATSKYVNCSLEEPIITALYNKSLQRYVLRINEAVKQKIKLKNNKNIDDILCCFRIVKRRFSDDDISLSQCIPLTNNIYVISKPTISILTECYAKNNASYLVQNDGFNFIQTLRQENTKATNDLVLAFTKKANNVRMPKPNVFIIGIDSLSRINFRRNMQKTYQYLRYNNWFEMEGYNKIADNSFHNLMAILTGYNESFVDNYCKPHISGNLDHCFFLWQRYKSHDYVTAYGEDDPKISTFNYDLHGFKNKPTDYYLRPFMLAQEQNLINQNRFPTISNCFYRHHPAQYVYDFCHEFYKRNRVQPKFGVFWTNSFSHYTFNGASAFDTLILNYLKDFETSGIFNSSIVIFLSNHGMRSGKLLELKQGYLEQRLPFLYIWLPKWFKTKYPTTTVALKRNRNRLSSPYDLHMTLKHILQLVNNDYIPKSALGCTNCMSLFQPLPTKRTCEDAGITAQWCACAAYEPFDDEIKSKKIAQLIVKKMNAFLFDKNLNEICKPFYFRRILLAERSKTKPETMYRIKFAVTPNDCVYETNVKYNEKSNKIDLKMTEIMKLNAKEEQTKCVSDKLAKRFCNCH